MIHGSSAFRKVSWNSNSSAFLAQSSPIRFTTVSVHRCFTRVMAAFGDRMLSTNWSQPTRPWLSMPLWCLGPADWGTRQALMDPWSLIGWGFQSVSAIYLLVLNGWSSVFWLLISGIPTNSHGLKWQTSRSDSELTSSYAEQGERERETENKMVGCWMYKRSRPWSRYVLHKIHLILHSLCQAWNPTIAISRIVRESSRMTPNFRDSTLNWLGYIWHVSVESCMPVLGMIKPPKMAWFSNYQFLLVPCNIGA